MKTDISKLIGKARQTIISYPKTGVKDELKNILKYILGRGYQNKDMLNWPNGLVIRGLVDRYESLKADEEQLVEAEEILNSLTDFAKKWISKGSRIYALDDAIAAEVFVFLYAETGNEDYADAAESVYRYLIGSHTDSQGSLIYRPMQGNDYILADMIGMVCPFLSMYGEVFDEAEAFSLAKRQLLNFIENAFDSKSRLPYHGYSLKEGIKHGIIGWGRAVGWVLLGMIYYLNYAAHDEDYERIAQAYKELSSAVLECTDCNGIFSWALPETEGHFDTSGTAMICDALSLGISDGLLAPGEFEELLENCMEALNREITVDGVRNALAECGGFGVHPQIYGSYLWSLGPVISFFSNMRTQS